VVGCSLIPSGPPPKQTPAHPFRAPRARRRTHRSSPTRKLSIYATMYSDWHLRGPLTHPTATPGRPAPPFQNINLPHERIEVPINRYHLDGHHISREGVQRLVHDAVGPARVAPVSSTGGSTALAGATRAKPCARMHTKNAYTGGAATLYRHPRPCVPLPQALDEVVPRLPGECHVRVGLRVARRLWWS
jgi:hypothetical protein